MGGVGVGGGGGDMVKAYVKGLQFSATPLFPLILLNSGNSKTRLGRTCFGQPTG